MFSWIIGLIDRFFAFVGALLFSQAPLFIQQYKQQLAGHVAELDRQVKSLTQTAELSGKTVEQYTQKFLQSSDIDFARQGEFIQDIVTRFKDYSYAWMSLNESTVWNRPFTFIKNLDMDIARKTYNQFEFGILFSLEGLIYALAGLVLGYLVFFTIKSLFRAILPKRRVKDQSIAKR